MTDLLSTEQIKDLADINRICESMRAQLVIIGATALQIQLGDLGRFTRDIDLTVALDLDDFRQLTQKLDTVGWRRSAKQEHRWVTPTQTIIDLLPAGPDLRRSGRIVWPENQFAMSLAGFDHVFLHSVAVKFLGGSSIQVASLPVMALLKIVAYTDDPYRRAKDLQDLRLLLRRYEHNSDRLFSDEVFDAALADFSLTNAFLLGLDLGRVATGEAGDYVVRFIGRFLLVGDEDIGFLEQVGLSGAEFSHQVRAFSHGFRFGCSAR